MAISRSDETDLLLPLHEGLHEQWATFLERLRRRTRAHYAALILGQGNAPIHRTAHFHAGEDIRADVARLGTLPELDPIPYEALRPGRVYSAQEMIGPAGSNTRFRAYLDQIGVGFGRFVRVTEPSGTSGWAIVARRTADFAASDSALLAALAPHLAIALRTFVAVERMRVALASTDDLLKRAGIDWRALDQAGQPVAGLNSGEPLGGRTEHGGDRLTVPVPALPRAATAMPASLLVARGPPLLGPRQQAALGLRHGLTAKEAQLALLLAGGCALGATAQQLGLTIETVRNYSKRLFAKTETRGQADLVRLVLTSVDLLA